LTKPFLEDQISFDVKAKKWFRADQTPVGRLWLPLLIAGLVLLLGWTLGLVRGPLMIDIGGDDRLDLLYLQPGEGGFFVSEKQQATNQPPGYDNSYRWTGRTAFINLPWPLDAVPLKATLRANAPRPDRSPDKPGTTLTATGVLANNNSNLVNLGQAELPGYYEGYTLTFALPVHLRPGLEAFRLRLDSSETFQPSKTDSRNLSAIFFGLKLEPDYAAFGWKGWLASLARPGLLALLSFFCWGISGFFTQRRSWRLAFEVTAGLVLLASLVWWPLAAEPFYLAWTLLLGLGWLLLALAGRFALAAPGQPAPLIYAATLLPLMPLAQFIFGRLDSKSLNPGFVSLIVYFAALLVCLVVYFAAQKRFEPIFVTSILIAAGLVFFYSHWRVYEQNLYRGGDFRNYYIGLLDIEDKHTPLYDLKSMAEFPGQAIRMPPAFAVLFWPLARLFGRDINTALLAWRVANEFLLVPTLWLLGQVFGRFKPGLKLWPALFFLVLNFGQLAETTGYGQQNYVLLFGLALAAYFVKREWDTLAGLALSLSIWVKLLPAVSGAFFLIERRWRGLLGLVVGAIIMNALTIGVVGWDNVWFYFTRAMWSVNEPELGITNQSWWGFMGRLAVTEVKGDFVGGFPTYLAPLGYLVALLGLGLTLLTGWRARGGDWLSQQLQLGALALVALWIPPFSWMHYIVPALVVIVAMLVALSRDNAPRPAIIVFAIAYILLAYGGRQEFFFGDALGLARLGSSYRFLATFSLWALNLWLLWQPSARPGLSALTENEPVERLTALLAATKLKT